MMKRTVFILAQFLICTMAHSKPIYLKCVVTEAPPYLSFKTEMAKKAFIEDAFDKGFAGFILNPDENWVLDLDKKQLRGASDTTVSLTDERETILSGRDRQGNSYLLDRLNLRMSVIRWIPEGQPAPMLAGTTLPTASKWWLQCRRMQKQI